LEAQTANPGSLHQEGQAARAELDRVRRLLLAELGVSTGRIVFTSGATEANNLALQTMLSVGSVAAAATEHASVAEVLALAQAGGASVTILAVDGAGEFLLSEVFDFVHFAINGLQDVLELVDDRLRGVRGSAEVEDQAGAVGAAERGGGHGDGVFLLVRF